MNSLAGNLLLASPVLMDPNFYHSVVYLIEHNEGGALGLIINRPLDVALGDVWESCPTPLAQAAQCAEGGPVERDKGILLHAFATVGGSHRLADGLVIGGSDADLSQAADHRRHADPLPRLFLGHAGWAPGQLEAELQRGGWLVRRSNSRWVLGRYDSDELWTDLLQAGNPVPDASVN